MANTYSPSSDIVFNAFFVESKEGKTGLTVTVNLYGPSGEIATAEAATEVDDTNFPGLYSYTLDSLETADVGRYTAVFHTATATVDQQDIVDEAYVAQWVADVPDMETDVDQIETLANTLKTQLDTYQASGSVPHFEAIGSHVSNALGADVLTVPKHNRADAILVQATTEDIRMTIDGTTPTSSVGFVITAGDGFAYVPLNKKPVKFLRSASGAVLQYQFVRTVRY